MLRMLLCSAVALAVLAPVPRAAAQSPAPLAPLRAVTPAGAQYGHLENAATGRRFTPRGANYVRLAHVDGRPFHATFEPGRYDAARTEAALAAMERDGYNAVRTFIDPGSIPHASAGQPHGLGRGVDDRAPVHGPYMDNVADFLRRATAHRIRVMFSLDYFPQNAYYYGLVGPVDHAVIDGQNLWYLQTGMVRAKEAYLRHFVTALRDRVGAPLLTTVLAYQLDNEAHVVSDKPPFSLSSGSVATQDGRTYDMARAEERQQAQDANFVAYATRGARAIRSVDPTALVTMGMFTYRAVGKDGPEGLPTRCPGGCPPGVDPRHPPRPWSLSTFSELSFLDLHIYPVHGARDDGGWTLDRDLASSDWEMVRGPVIIGEFGAFKAEFQDDVVRAAQGMRDLQVDTCARGAAGWLYWTWDTGEDPDQQRIYTLVHDPLINEHLAPVVRGDACRREPSPFVRDEEWPPAAAPPGAAPTPGTQPARARRLALRVRKVSLGRALRRGLRVSVKASRKGKLTGRVARRGRTVARGARRVTRPGRTTLKLAFTQRARSRLRGARRARLRVQVKLEPRRGAAWRGTTTVVLKR